MKAIKKYIVEKLDIGKAIKQNHYVEFNPDDTSYEGKIDLSLTSNDKIEYYKLYDSDLKVIAWVEIWIEGIKDSYTTVIVQDDVYEYLSEFVSGYDKDWGFGIVNADEKLYKQLYGILDECDNLFLTTVEKWFEFRETSFDTQPQYLLPLQALYHKKIEPTLGK
jgi:hypothetical protein